ncbi:uncharacterized protein MYCFIDRAFT_212095 [Pseudocercospora fijiensis CIRAD86]|uniref:SnoaL-like domain-containing protein n=1 Tax=Pseudocercospora fijiensis (strain CIRAD86) TaxID=383855 RepID=M3ANB4_PSEFD|nr:uncharacterized protein MYCFIDRAFT_212095 [Pseudocercospora fijiensis CIRAD86]EME78967.1 hypothetical protein MYCFIDRAFT_212095 [Pseudocercospora fijiensis CIRAD86]
MLTANPIHQVEIARQDSSIKPVLPLTDALDGLSAEGQIRGIMDSLIFVINNRVFDRASLPWTRFVPDFQAGTNIALPIRNSREVFDMFQTVAAACPDYKVTLSHAQILVDEEAGSAKVSWKGESVGLFPGITIPNIGVTEFERIDGRWWVSRSDDIRGQGDYPHVADLTYLQAWSPGVD